MGTLHELDRLLIAADGNFETYDYVYRDDANALFRKLTDDDWIQLRSLWKHRPPEWQLILTTLLEEGPPKETVPIFVEMLESVNIELMEAVLDVLPTELPDISLSEPVIARLLRKSERFHRNDFLKSPNLPRLLKAAGHLIQK